MFGDSLYSLTATFALAIGDAPAATLLNLPLGGGGRVFKNEHSRALPTDRVFGLYHHFQNALESSSPTNSFRPADANLDRYTFGFEKTFFDGVGSVELRMPFSSPVSLSTPGTNYQTQSVGDLVVTLKGLLYADENQAVSLGLGINTPTGSDLQVSLMNPLSTASVTIHNNATHLIPFIAYQAAPTEDFFFHSFLQIDTPTNANSVQIRTSGPSIGGGPPPVDPSIKDATLLFVDASLGYWLFRDPDAQWLTGLAGLLELHYTGSLNPVHVTPGRQLPVSFTANTNRIEVVNLTIGLHTQISRSTIIRAGYVTPLGNDEHRFFDSEVTLAVIFRM